MHTRRDNIRAEQQGREIGERDKTRLTEARDREQEKLRIREYLFKTDLLRLGNDIQDNKDEGLLEDRVEEKLSTLPGCKTCTLESGLMVLPSPDLPLG